MGTVIAANSDYPYGDIYTSNSNHLHSNTQVVNGAILQGSAASARSAGRLSSSCVQAASDIHNMDVYDAYMEMGSRISTTTSSVEAQELAEVLRGILDDDSELLFTAAKHDLPAPLAEGHVIPLANPFNFMHSPDHHHESTSSLNSTQHYSDLDHDEELHNHEQVTNPIPNCMSSTCGGALLSDLSLLDYDNHHFDDTNHGSISSATCSKPMYHNLDGFTLCGIDGGEEANYGLSSSLSQEAANHAERGGVDDDGALKNEAEICSDLYDNFTKGSLGHAPINACKELHNMQLCPQAAYQMVCDHDGLYPSGMPMMQREAMYAAAAMQPVDWPGILAVSAGTRPKRRNVRISHDPQTASARRRRERISDRIRVLQRLVPGGTKMDTASMLDEAIHYLKYLKSQVQALQWLETRSSPLSSSSSCFYPNVATTSLPNPRLIK